MEETIKISILGHEQNISKESIASLKPIITQQCIRGIRLPSFIKHFQPDSDVLHACVYYLIAIQKNLQEAHQLSFRQKCLCNISQYYIAHNMNFQLYEYGFLCTKIIPVLLDKALHIIYFLVYTRLASKPFINNLITRMEKKDSFLNKRNIFKSEKSFSIQTKMKSHQSRHLTIFCDSNQIQSQILKKELHKIMNPNKESKKMTKKTQNKRMLNSRRAEQNADQKLNEPVLYQSANTSRVVSIPVKVRSNQNSSVITRLKFITGINKQENHYKKIQVRRQKFNQWFSSTAKYQKMMSENEAKQNQKPQWGTIKNFAQKEVKNIIATAYKNQRHPYEYYQSIASNIRSKNDQLDSIRYECFHHDDKSITSIIKQPISLAYSQKLLNKNSIKSQNQNVQRVHQNYRSMQSNIEVIKEDYSKNDQLIQNDNNQFSKTVGVGKFSHPQDYGNITRKNDAFCYEDETRVLFNKKVKNKFKLQKYKHEFRHFLKTQIFQRVKHSQ